MSDLDKDKVLEDFTKAYTAAHGKAPEIEAKGGWYSVDGGKNMRLAQLAEQIDTLNGTAEKKDTATSKPNKVEKKSNTKPADTFSVKDFYNKQISERNPGAIPPR